MQTKNFTSVMNGLQTCPLPESSTDTGGDTAGEARYLVIRDAPSSDEAWVEVVQDIEQKKEEC